MSAKAKLAGAYGRVSGHQQEREETIETQRWGMDRWAEQNGVTIVDYYFDQGVKSEIPIHERPQGHRLLADAAAGRFGIALIYNSKRWSRYREVAFDGWERLGRCGVELKSIKENLSRRTPSEKLSTGMLFLVSEFDRDTITETFMDGRYRRASENGYCGGICPYGYRTAPDPLQPRRSCYIIENAEAEVVRLIFDLLVRQRMTCFQIAEELNHRGIPTATQRQGDGIHRSHWKNRTTQGRWIDSRVAAIIRNSAYKGEKWFGGGERERVLQRYPVIIPPDLWEQGQERLAANRTTSQGNAKEPYLLTGILKCSHCRTDRGEPVTFGRQPRASGSNRSGAHYVCNYRRNRMLRGNKPPCPFPYLPAASLEEEVWQDVRQHILRHEETMLMIQQQDDGIDEQRAELLNQRDRALAEKARFQTAHQRNYESRQLGEVTQEMYEKARERFDKEIERYQQCEDMLAQRMDRLADRSRRLQAAEQSLARWQHQIDAPMTAAERQDVVRQVLDAIVVEPADDGGVVLAYRFVFRHEEGDVFDSPVSAHTITEYIVVARHEFDRA